MVHFYNIALVSHDHCRWSCGQISHSLISASQPTYDPHHIMASQRHSKAKVATQQLQPMICSWAGSTLIIRAVVSVLSASDLVQSSPVEAATCVVAHL